MMHFNIFMTRQQVIEQYGIPPELETEVFAKLKPVMGTGANAQYLESRVDQQLEKYFEQKDRPALAAVKSYLNEEAINMIDAVGANNELANVLRDAFEWMKPRLEAVLGLRALADQEEQTVTPEQAARQLKMNVQTVMRWCRERRLTAFKVGRRWLIERESLEAYMRKCEMIHERAGRAS